ncbi:RTA1-domain-containing protein [Sistotremastrum niveocremeum HHB9708]|uniref:RTA1-domain-containing protein n=1 Tax=Sistotremastrum niveocremeum HHB9708 TaxID=1314777 RepID=A0A164XIS6_9AGAM|nr:RTA1-domain-containing protein [Sistotremastrum niveocremeum HHB9708]
MVNRDITTGPLLSRYTDSRARQLLCKNRTLLFLAMSCNYWIRPLARLTRTFCIKFATLLFLGMSESNSTIPIFIPSIDSQYGYIPTQWVCIVFLAFFGLAGVLHILEAIFFKVWWLLPTACLAALGEVIGWSGRFWSSKNPSNHNAFLMQISTTIISPTPLLAANFIVFGILLERLGSGYSFFRPKRYIQMFCCIDVIALVIQAVGGALASTQTSSALGGHIALAGIVVQLASILFFISLVIDYYLRFHRNSPYRAIQNPPKFLDKAGEFSSFGISRMPRHLRLMTIGFAFSTLCILIRAIYRTIELADGWGGRIIDTQVYFNVLDGMMIVLAMVTLNVLHPGLLLGRGVKGTRL